MLRFLLSCCVCFSLVPFIQADEVDREAVLRLGNMVQYCSGHGQSAEDLAMEALGPPAADSDKWFISVVTIPGCAPCQKLKQEWSTQQNLLALANPADPKTSWSHYQVYDFTDESQKWRFEKLAITKFPTIIVQPPRSGKYGDPSTVVFQDTYQGKPAELASAITSAIRRYVTKLNAAVQAAATPTAFTNSGNNTPPWTPAPREQPMVQPQTVLPLPQVIPPPEQNPNSGFPIGTFFLGVGVPLGILAAGYALRFIRAQRQASGKPPILNDEQFETLLKLLQQVPTAPNPPKK